MFDGRRIHLCVTGGIAAYKAVLLLRALQRQGAVVRVAMTANATAFIGPLTFQALTGAPVLLATVDPGQELSIGHIEFAQACDALVVAPATANIIGKMAGGLADDIVSTVLLAAGPPVVLAPAMNTVMWENCAVQENLARLRSRGVHVVEPGRGQLACGAVGAGRLAPIEHILATLQKALTPQRLAGRRLVVSAGPTREALDPARFLSNPSTGRAGFAIAAAATAAGAQVELVHGPVCLDAPVGVKMTPIYTAREMHAAVLAAAQGADAVVMSAAVADYRPAEYTASKIKKGGPMTVELARNPDILAELGALRQGQQPVDSPVLVGFAAETGDPVPAARLKLERKAVDLIVANDISAPDAGFAGPNNRVTFVERDGVRALPLMSKTAIGHQIVEWIADRLSLKGEERR